jgi:hypothetical protein
MAWKLGGARLAAGETNIHWFWWGSSPNQQWKGIQVYAAKAVPDPPIGELKARLQQPSCLMVHDAEVIWTVEGYTYRVQVTNKGPGSTDYELWGTEA